MSVGLNDLGHDFFISWITFHFQEFQSAAIREKIIIEFKPKVYKINMTSEALFVICTESF